MGWPVYTALYYAVNAGFSIGYSDVEEPMSDQITQAFTICYIFIGSVIVAGCMNFSPSYSTTI